VGQDQTYRFLQAWASLEGWLMSLARERWARFYSVREAVDVLARDSLLAEGVRHELDQLRRTHNTAVHEPLRLNPGQLGEATEALQALSQTLPPSFSRARS
jgi:hypothetical protein